VLCAVNAIPREAPPKLPALFQKGPLFIELERRWAIKFFVEEGMKRVEMTGRLIKRHGGMPFSERKCVTE
jgi:hypothetical protein